MCILVRSHHITCGEENTAVWLWGFYLFFFVLSLPGFVLRCCLTHALKQIPHNSTSSNTVSWWSGTSFTLSQPSLKSRPSAKPWLTTDPHCPPRTALGQLGGERALWQKRTPWQTDWWDLRLNDVTFLWPLLYFQSYEFFFLIIGNVNKLSFFPVHLDLLTASEKQSSSCFVLLWIGISVLKGRTFRWIRMDLGRRGTCQL